MIYLLFIGITFGGLCGTYPSFQCQQCGGDNDGCPDSNGHVSICGGYGDCDSNDECAGEDLVCGTNNCHDVTYGGVSLDTQERLRRTTTNWVSDSYCQYDSTDDCCMNRESCFHGDNLLLLDSGEMLHLHNLSKLEKYEVMKQDGTTAFVSMDLWAMKKEADRHTSSEKLYMEICVHESCVTVTDNHAIAFKNRLGEHDFKIAQKVEEGDMIFMRDAEYSAVTRVESKMMNSSTYVPVNLKGYTYIMFGDLAVPLWGDYRGVNITSQEPLYQTWLEFFETACYMDTLFGHCTALMEGDGMANIVRQIMDASMDFARTDNNITTASYNEPRRFILDAFPDMAWIFFVAEHITFFALGGAAFLFGLAFLTYKTCSHNASSALKNEEKAVQTSTNV